MKNNFNNQKGYMILMTTFFTLLIMSAVAVSMSFLVANAQKNITNSVKATQSYYAAESGEEDALLRLKKTPQMSATSYSFSVNNVPVAVTIPNTVGPSKLVTSTATNGTIVKNVQALCTIGNGSSSSFYYGVEVGPGGLSMSNGSEIKGNVFSEGNITGSGTIDNNVVISGNGNSIGSGAGSITVAGNAVVYSCLSGATIKGNLTYVQGGTKACTVNGTTTVQSASIADQPMPIPQSQIDTWKNQAASASVFNGSKNIANGASVSLGPVKITGSLIVNNSATLTLTGTVYVVGNVTISNNSKINLDSSYGSTGGVIISDGIISIGNGNIFTGSGQAGSYVMLLSTNVANNAINISNNATGAVFYTNAGGITIANNVSLTEATGYKVIMNNNAIIQYSSGIVNIYFTSGPGGGWSVSNWQEY